MKKNLGRSPAAVAESEEIRIDMFPGLRIH